MRLYYLHQMLTSDDPTYYGATAISCTQIEIGYSIMASIVPCLKTFMAPYERPDPGASHYHNSGNGTNYKLSSMASRSENEPTAGASSASVDRTSGVDTQYLGTGKKTLGKLRPEQTVYEAKVTHNRLGGERRGSIDSAGSQRMIIKKGFEWSVDYDARNGSVVGKEGDAGPYGASDEIRSER